MKDKEMYEELINELISNMNGTSSGKRVRISKLDNLKNKISMYLFKLYLSFFVRKEKKDFTKKRKIKDYKVACILDEFSYNCFKSELDLYPISRDNYIKQLKSINPDILFVESAWHSYQGDWGIAHQLEDVKKILMYCKRRGITTIFWNKEDPVHFDDFIKKAVRFDYIFTTDDMSVSNYKKYTKKNNVFPLMFAAEPKIHNPIREKDIKRCDKSVFAGTFYRNKYPDRLKSLMEIMYVARDYGLDIYDRNYLLKNKNYSYPNMYQKNIVGNLPYNEINKAYKGYKINININSVTESSTMFSRRVFEVLACNTPVVSNYSIGIKKVFGDIVQMGKNIADFANIYEKLYNDNEYYEDICTRGVREVLSKHTYKNRVEEIFDMIGIPYIKERKKLLVIGIMSDKSDANKIISSYEKQTLEDKFLILFSDKKISSKYECYTSIKDVYNIINKYDYLAIMNGKDSYGENYLLDLFLADKYLDDIYFIGKDNNNEYQYVDNLDIKVGIIKSDIISSSDNLKKYFDGELKIKEGKSFAINRFSYIKK